MADTKVKRKFSDLSLTVDNGGRFRIGGKFASKSQVGRWKGARKRRGLKVRIPKFDPVKAAKVRSQQSKKAARTRLGRKRGVKFLGQRKTKVFGFVKRTYELPDIETETVAPLVDSESDRVDDDLLMNMVAEGDTEDGEKVVVGTRFFNALVSRNVGSMIRDLESKVAAYFIASINRYLIVFSLSRG